MDWNRRQFLSGIGALSAGTLMSPLFASRKPDNLGTQTGINAFAFDVHTRLREQKGNIFFSPFSISTALAMTAGGARNETLQQMAKALHCPGIESDPIGHAAYGELIGQLVQIDTLKRSYQLDVANGLFAQNGYPWRAEYLKLVRDQYRATLQDLNFASESEAARKTINDWTEKKTQSKIKNLFAQGSIDSLARLVLVNAIYFKATWETPFKKASTREAPFFLEDGSMVNTPLMDSSLSAKLSETDDLQFLDLPYKGGEISLQILLPKTHDGLSALERKLDADTWAKWNKQLQPVRSLQVTIPKFKIEAKYDLNQMLQSMGMSDAFDFTKADFDGMVRERPEGALAITKVVHQTVCDVDEEGTEAAAATGVAVGVRSLPVKSRVFKADHPFLFAIRHHPSQTILFLGRFAKPTA